MKYFLIGAAWVVTAIVTGWLVPLALGHGINKLLNQHYDAGDDWGVGFGVLIMSVIFIMVSYVVGLLVTR